MRVVPCLLLLCCACQLGASVRVVLEPVDAGGSVSTYTGGVVSLNCSLEGGASEQEALEWHRNGESVRLDSHNRFSPSRLCVQNVTTDDHQVTFTCHLRSNPTVCASAQIKVHFPPALSGTDYVTVEESQDVVLRCPVWAYPQVTVTWLRDDLPLNLVTHRYTLYQDSREAQLTITNVQREQHQRWYSCVARSAEFGERTKTFQLLVEDKKMGFPLVPLIAACVVVLCTTALAIVARWDRISKCWK
ncbi:transmembrane and immunoglobulin domain-containing protein 1-like [Clupea harengus]|uniref:transmembrane and immunoglobulin domain-containing protein 1-like n=1 Tax=Clupea harengus TaxID=7950 RepID=UPI0012AC337E|nr:transmembrane and immunoglobulin domain-containing protein 1-like [Clupea harengus]